MPGLKRTIIAVICLCAFFVSAVAVSGQNGPDLDDEPNNSAEQNAGPDLRAHGQEKLESRTEFSKSFRQGGLTAVFVSSQPIHYKDKAGKWHSLLPPRSPFSFRKYCPISRGSSIS